MKIFFGRLFFCVGFITFILYPIALMKLIYSDWDNDIAGFGSLFHLIAIFISLFIVPVYLYVTFYVLRYVHSLLLKKNSTNLKQPLKNAFVSLGVIGTFIPIALVEFLKLVVLISAVNQVVYSTIAYLLTWGLAMMLPLATFVLLAFLFYRSFKSFRNKSKWRLLRVVTTLFCLAFVLLFMWSYIDMYGFDFFDQNISLELKNP